MAEQTTQKTARKNDGTPEKNFPVSFNKIKTKDFSDDELISTLSESYENRRAVQAYKWESIRLGISPGRGHNA